MCVCVCVCVCLCVSYLALYAGQHCIDQYVASRALSVEAGSRRFQRHLRFHLSQSPHALRRALVPWTRHARRFHTLVRLIDDTQPVWARVRSVQGGCSLGSVRDFELLAHWGGVTREFELLVPGGRGGRLCDGDGDVHRVFRVFIGCEIGLFLCRRTKVFNRGGILFTVTIEHCLGIQLEVCRCSVIVHGPSPGDWEGYHGGRDGRRAVQGASHCLGVELRIEVVNALGGGYRLLARFGHWLWTLFFDTSPL